MGSFSLWHTPLFNLYTTVHNFWWRVFLYFFLINEFLLKKKKKRVRQMAKLSWSTWFSEDLMSSSWAGVERGWVEEGQLWNNPLYSKLSPLVCMYFFAAFAPHSSSMTAFVIANRHLPPSPTTQPIFINKNTGSATAHIATVPLSRYELKFRTLRTIWCWNTWPNLLSFGSFECGP